MASTAEGLILINVKLGVMRERQAEATQNFGTKSPVA
jgi:hypothetical protein